RARWRARWRGRRAGGPGRWRASRQDGGLTLIEVVVAMSIMSVAMTIFTTGVVQLYRLTNHAEALATAQTQLNLAVQRLDAEIRYASGISTPAAVGGDSYVEYLLTGSGTATCVEVRLLGTATRLQRRSWPQENPPPTGGWRTLAFDVTDGQPFTFIPADTTFTTQRLRLTLTAHAGGAGTGLSRQTDVTFTAVNTSLATQSATVCTEGRAVP
ncbi:MAG: prepilin-type N-terminal cleavage/methylation domain-containing protein, partial [Dactylosporangium sp.]|nr:prepilin-type N-terminal cleavage/methylation domain-containing protein [Dactylosporangium sp.]NNJ61994.1 prepilin-type N-terminal cleavage/methylation domain-containing protein [Dactylosporangium sp.]